MIWSADTLSKALGIACFKHLHANQIQFNSKDVQPGDLFIALKGARDGHEFIFDAAKNGAGILIINYNKFEEIKLQAEEQIGAIDSAEYKAFIERLLKVENTENALHKLAKYKRDHSKAKFITITGSAGKTSTKEALNIILSRFGKCFASRGNFNNKLGLAINLASMPDDIDYAVLELGMNVAGEILELTKQARPDIAAVTSIFGVHLEYFESVEKIAEAKCEIFEGIDPEQGVAILPGDYENYNTCRAKLEEKSIRNIRSFKNITLGKTAYNEEFLEETTSTKLPLEMSFAKGSNELSSNYSADGSPANAAMVSYEVLGSDVKLAFDIGEATAHLTMPYIPKHIAGNFTLCLLIAQELGLDLNIATESLKSFTLGIGRGRVISCLHQGKDLTIITDYYNSNPESLKRSLENLANMAASLDTKAKIRKLAIIGDMGELGERAVAQHQSILEHVQAAGVELLILVGDLAKHVADNNKRLTKVVIYQNIDDLLSNIDALIKHDDLILIKASRFMKFERIAKYLGIENAL